MKSEIALVCLLVAAILYGCGDSRPAESKGPEVVSASAPARAGAVIIPTNGVAMGKEEMSEKEGIPIYPGSIAPEGQSSVVADSAETRYTMVLVTQDSVKQVVDFYTNKIPGISAVGSANSSDLIGQTPKGTLAHIKIGSKDKKTTIEASAVVETPKISP